MQIQQNACFKNTTAMHFVYILRPAPLQAGAGLTHVPTVDVASQPAVAPVIAAAPVPAAGAVVPVVAAEAAGAAVDGAEPQAHGHGWPVQV